VWEHERNVWDQVNSKNFRNLGSVGKGVQKTKKEKVNDGNYEF